MEYFGLGVLGLVTSPIVVLAAMVLVHKVLRPVRRHGPDGTPAGFLSEAVLGILLAIIQTVVFIKLIFKEFNANDHELTDATLSHVTMRCSIAFMVDLVLCAGIVRFTYR